MESSHKLSERKEPFWNAFSSWKEAELAWDQGSVEAEEQQKNRSLKHLPRMISITPQTKRFLSTRAARHLLFPPDGNGGREIRRALLRHPLRYATRHLRATLQKSKVLREGPFSLHGYRSLQEFEEDLCREDTLVVVGFSYCEKPFECPSRRFSLECIHDPDHPVCRQCWIGKMQNALPSQNHVRSLIIRTVHDIGEELFALRHAHPQRKIIFLITACTLAIEMFKNWPQVLSIRGVSVHFAGRICNTFSSFLLAEKGIKPGLVVTPQKAKERMLSWIRLRRELGKEETRIA